MIFSITLSLIIAPHDGNDLFLSIPFDELSDDGLTSIMPWSKTVLSVVNGRKKLAFSLTLGLAICIDLGFVALRAMAHTSSASFDAMAWISI